MPAGQMILKSTQEVQALCFIKICATPPCQVLNLWEYGTTQAKTEHVTIMEEDTSLIPYFGDSLNLNF